MNVIDNHTEYKVPYCLQTVFEFFKVPQNVT